MENTIERKRLHVIYWAALAVRLVLLLFLVGLLGQNALFFSDTREYLGLADALRHGAGFVLNGAAYTGRTPGYPLFLAALGGSSSVPFIAIIQIVLASFIPVLTYLVAKELGFERRIATIAAWIAVFEPHMAYYSITILPDALFTVFFFSFLLSAIRWLKTGSMKGLAVSSILFAILLYIKPVLQAFPLFLAITALVHTFITKAWKPLKAFAIFAILVFLISSPWMYWNAKAGEGFTMSSQGPSLVAFKLATSVMSVSDHVTFDEAEKILESRWDKTKPIPLGDVANYLLQHPTAVARVLVMNSVLLWTSQTYTYIPNYYGFLPLPPSYNEHPPSVLLLQGKFIEFGRAMGDILKYPYTQLAIIGKLLWAMAAFLFFFGLIRALIERKQAAWKVHVFIALLVLCYTMTAWIDGFNVEARLRYPFNPLMFIYAASASFLIFRTHRKKSHYV